VRLGGLRRSLLLALVVALWCAGLPSTIVAQSGDVATLQARVRQSPDDPQLAFALMGASCHEEAVSVASPAIVALRARSGRTSARTLGACLYNRGRAHEALGHRNEAVIDYADSLDRRANETVSARLRSLVPELPELPPLAAVAATIDEFAFGPESTATAARSGDGQRWWLVTSGRGEHPQLVAITRVNGEVRAAEIDRGWFDNDQRSRPRRCDPACRCVCRSIR
jgi:hypothetical protein